MYKKILIIDDEKTLLETLCDALELSGNYTVRTVSDSRKAVDAALKFQPDLVLLDVMMPDLDGGEVAALMRENESLKNVPVIFQTAVLSKKEESHHHSSNPKEHFLIKPVSIDELITAIESLT
jgi:DNA-binding response OmpR family regulator